MLKSGWGKSCLEGQRDPPKRTNGDIGFPTLCQLLPELFFVGSVTRFFVGVSVAVVHILVETSLDYRISGGCRPCRSCCHRDFVLSRSSEMFFAIFFGKGPGGKDCDVRGPKYIVCNLIRGFIFIVLAYCVVN